MKGFLSELGLARNGSLRSVAIISTYLPRPCGIATFSADLLEAMRASGSNLEFGVIALNAPGGSWDYPDDVVFEIEQNRLKDYRQAAEFIMTKRYDAVVLQHEYNIFGGRAGSHILNLLGLLNVPVVTTLHTIPKEPDPDQRRVIEQLGRLSQCLVVMSDTAERFLEEVYGIPRSMIVKIPHGVPDLPFIDSGYFKDMLGAEGQWVLLTFGLLHPGKGIETALRALPAVTEKFPNLLYVILGATHPEIKKREGEKYRQSLQRLCRSLGIERNVLFIDRFVEAEELWQYLGAADIFLTPYRFAEQISSGTLTQAMSAGKVVVSTPYWYAQEMLADGRGVLFPFDDHEALARVLLEVLGDEKKRLALRKAAFRYCRDRVWHQVGRQYVELLHKQHRDWLDAPRSSGPKRIGYTGVSAPELDFRHLSRLCDDTGLVRFALQVVPARQSGYSTVENSRLLALTGLAADYTTTTEPLDRLAMRAASFVLHACEREDGAFFPLMNYDRAFTAREPTQLETGQLLWNLGVVAATHPQEGIRLPVLQVFHRLLERVGGLDELLPLAFATLGLSGYLRRYGGDSRARRVFNQVRSNMKGLVEKPVSRDWPWPENKLWLENPRIPHALINAGDLSGDRGMTERGLELLEWLWSVESTEGHFSPVGNQGWYERGGRRARFDQLPQEADAMVAACAAAYRVTGERVWIERLVKAFQWFLGDNDAGVPLYDPGSGGCHDGLGPGGCNENEGATSMLAWLSALLRVHALQASGELGWTREAVRAAGGRTVQTRGVQ